MKAIDSNAALATQLRIVLVGTTHPGNIGATARAMRNMGLTRLYLVAPKQFPHVEATARAAGADELLAKAVVVDELAEALTDCDLVLGTSARIRGITLPELTPRAAAQQACQEATQQRQIALVFGRESSGLSNTELAQCHTQICIPTDPSFSSLNLAAAVLLVVYELRSAFLEATPTAPADTTKSLANHQQMQHFYQHLDSVLTHTGFLKTNHTKKMRLRLQRLFNRARLETTEVHILEGMLSAIETHLS